MFAKCYYSQFCGLKRCALKVGDDDFCYVCRDRLQQEFNQKEDEWYFINAQRREEDGKVCHAHCMQVIIVCLQIDPSFMWLYSLPWP